MYVGDVNVKINCVDRYMNMLFIVSVLALVAFIIHIYYHSISDYINRSAYVQNNGSVGDSDIDTWLYNIRKFKVYNPDLIAKLYDSVNDFVSLRTQYDHDILYLYKDIQNIISEMRFYVPDDEIILEIYDFNTNHILRKCEYIYTEHTRSKH